MSFEKMSKSKSVISLHTLFGIFHIIWFFTGKFRRHILPIVFLLEAVFEAKKLCSIAISRFQINFSDFRCNHIFQALMKQML